MIFLETPTASAFIQAWIKIKVDVLKLLFNYFNEKTQEYVLSWLLAIDGSELPIGNTYIYAKETIELRFGIHAKPYFAYHLNVSYDLLEWTYDAR